MVTNRLQGTDGVRREVRLSSDPSLEGMQPLQAFTEKGFITEEFMEFYTFCYVTDLIERGEMKIDEDIVIGWDPRDTEGIFTSASVDGIRKAGGKAVVLGIVPTPAVPIYMLYRGARGSCVVTASHNPKGQNGIKIFNSKGLKFFPEDDIRLTKRIYEMDYHAVKKQNFIGKLEIARDDALRVFTEFSCDSRNSWVYESDIFSMIILIVDPANGSFSGIAADIFRRLKFKEIIEVNNNLNGDVNLNCGVIALDEISSIPSDMIQGGGKFENNKTINKIFQIGRERKEDIEKGEVRVSGAVFDADGDRFYRVDYNPFDDTVIVLSGDETAFLQAAYLMKRYPERYRSSLYVNTVESDFNAAIAAERIGFKTILTGVGDKWLLREATQTLRTFAIGSEESGHTITEGYLRTKDGRDKSVFIGNGLKSAMNTFVASESLFSEAEASHYFQKLNHPFEHSFKKTFYIYNTNKPKLARGTDLWKKLEVFIKNLILDQFENGVELYLKERDEEPDMLYIAIYGKGEQPPLSPFVKGDLRGCIFVRNSGTEEKTGIHIRGSLDYMKRLVYIGENVMNYLKPVMSRQ
jgi:phosphomannomutase